MRSDLLGTRNGRFLTFGLLYVSEGIPYGFTSVAMVAFMRQRGVSLEAIGAFSAALFLPWAFKWAWAPLIDLIRHDRWGGRRAWIVACTSLMLLTLLLASIDAGQHFQWLLAAVIALLVIGLIPFLRAREEPAQKKAPVLVQAVPLPVVAGE